jgi:DNA-binding NarL/FixJ family response regulator
VRSAGRAQARGGLAAAAAFLERAAALTPDPAARAARALAAAQAEYEAGMPDAAVKQLASAEAGRLGELERARLERLQAQIAFTRLRGSDAPRLLLRAARRLGPLDAALARETYLEALWAAIRAGRSGDSPTVREVAEAALAAPPASDPPRAVDLLLDGLVTRSVKGHVAAVPALERALGALGFAERTDRELLATGERICKRTIDIPARLTARETQIGRLASDGLSNPGIAVQRFMSPRTVEYHLRKIFTKLAISSRNQLHGALANSRN